jgi:hypothetical protein
MFAPGFATFIVGRTIQGLSSDQKGILYTHHQTSAMGRGNLRLNDRHGHGEKSWVDYGFNFLLPENISWQGPFIIQIVLSFFLVGMSPTRKHVSSDQKGILYTHHQTSAMGRGNLRLNDRLPENISWQGPFIIQIVLSFFLVGMSFFLPETPRLARS